ncbi:MAG: ComF family protein [Akkermansia sp.]|nr:ComF family protein [Akkermansia sp.]
MLDWLYPNTCELCGELSGATICPACLAGLERVPRPICLYCGAPTYGLETGTDRCRCCRVFPRVYDFARAALMRTPVTTELVHAFKYARASHLCVALAPLLANVWEQTPELREHGDWVLVPVPVERGRLMRRGYNQAEELARALGKLRGLRMLQLLQRVGTEYTSQTRLSARERQLNARQAYRLIPGITEAPPHLLLVDDVYTTGATARACAAALRRLSGVQKIGVLTLLRAE